MKSTVPNAKKVKILFNLVSLSSLWLSILSCPFLCQLLSSFFFLTWSLFIFTSSRSLFFLTLIASLMPLSLSLPISHLSGNRPHRWDQPCLWDWLVEIACDRVWSFFFIIFYRVWLVFFWFGLHVIVGDRVGFHGVVGCGFKVVMVLCFFSSSGGGFQTQVIMICFLFFVFVYKNCDLWLCLRCWWWWCSILILFWFFFLVILILRVVDFKPSDCDCDFFLIRIVICFGLWFGVVGLRCWWCWCSVYLYIYISVVVSLDFRVWMNKEKRGVHIREWKIDEEERGSY